MDGGEGMVAVVRGLQGSGLAVTLLDSGRQFTLLPEAYTHPTQTTIANHTRGTTASQCASQTRRESSVQATDGRYTSMYKMMHCHSTPTSPPEQVTEFPPQRAELYPGHGNFIVGGQGSGESHINPMKSNEFRGAMCWPDRGSVFSPRPSLQPDSFATSLRKYPNISPDRSSEIVERLINFTQAKNACKNKRNASPSRYIGSNMSNQTFCLDHKSSRNTNTEQLKGGYQPEVIIRPKRLEESPSREIRTQDPAEVEEMESWRKPTFCKTNDVRYLKDISRKVREGIRSLSAQPENRPERLNSRERCDSMNRYQRALPQWSTNKVNMEIQATVPVTSREIMTLSRIVPSQRTIALPLTPTSSSKTDEKSEGRELDTLNIDKEKPIHHIEQIIQTKFSLVDIHVQTVSSAIDFSFRKKYKRKGKIRSRSEEKLQIIELMKYRNAGVLKPSGLKSQSYRSHYKTKPREILVEFINKFESQIFNVGISSNRKYALDKYCPPMARMYRTEYKMVDEGVLNDILNSWINLIPLKAKNKFDARKEKKCIKYYFCNYLKRFVHIPPEHIRKDKFKTDILNRLKLIPLDVKSDNIVVLNRLADNLINRITHTSHRRWDTDINESNKNNLQDLNNSTSKRFKLPNEKDIEDFISQYTILCLQNNDLSLPEPLLKNVQDELLGILRTSLKAINNDDDNVKRAIALLLHDYGLSQQQAKNCSQVFIKIFKQTFMTDTKPFRIRSKTFIVLPNTCCYGSIGNELDNKIKSTVDDDIVTNIKQYKNQLCQQINDWLNNLHIQIPETHENELKQEAVNDLAKDIIERHKYLELNPCNEITDEIEVDHLKYQIFKWINKFIGEGNLEPMQRASDLINRIKNISVPMLSKVQANQVRNSSVTPDKSPELDIVCRHNTNVSTKTNNIVNEKSLLCDNLSCQSEGVQHNIELSIKKDKNTNGLYVSSNTKHGNVKSNCMTSKDIIQNTDKSFISIPCASTSEPCCPKPSEISKSIVLNTDMKSNEQLEAEYEQFVEDWIQKIPMIATDFGDDAILEKARLGIYNGLWKVVSKLNCDPATYHNRFLYEDLLDDAIDDLLNCLPQSSNLKCKRHLLKVEFIEKTIFINDQIKENEEALYKNKLIQSIVTDLRKQGITDNRDGNSTKLQEDLQIVKLVENYMLVTKFKNEDKVTSEIYRKKLIKEVVDFVSNLKKNHAKKLKNIDVATYETEIINILNNVALPSEYTLNQEANDVLLGFEIEQWYDDLPVISNNDYTEQYYRKMQRDILAKKIKEIESKSGLDATDSPLRNEVSKFLEKTPLEEGESLNINFMVDELVNRLKNKTKYNHSLNTKRGEPEGPESYDEFSKDISFCSSFIETPQNRLLQEDAIKKFGGTQYNEITSCGRHLCNDSTTRIHKSKDKNSNSSPKQTRVIIQEPPSYKIFDEERPLSSSFKSDNEQWLTLQNGHSNVSIQTQNIDMHTLPPYIETQKNNETMQRNYQSNIELRGIQKCYQKPRDSYPGDTQQNRGYEENMDVENYPSISKKLTGVSPYQLKNIGLSFREDITTVGEVNEHTCKDEEDQSSPMCSVECQTNNNKTNYTNSITVEFDTTLEKDQISEATNTLLDNISVCDESVHREARGPTIPIAPSNRKARLATRENDSVRKKLSFDSDEDEDMSCKCIQKYLKYRQKRTRYPCEDFDRLPPCLPFVFPYPYFI